MSCTDEEKDVELAEKNLTLAERELKQWQEDCDDANWWYTYQRANIGIVPLEEYLEQKGGSRRSIAGPVKEIGKRSIDTVKAGGELKSAQEHKSIAEERVATQQEALEHARNKLKRCRDKLGWLEPASFKLTSTVKWRWLVLPDAASATRGELRGSGPAFTVSETVIAETTAFEKSDNAFAFRYTATCQLSYTRTEQGSRSAIVYKDATDDITLTPTIKSTSPGILTIRLSQPDYGDPPAFKLKLDITSPTCEGSEEIVVTHHGRDGSITTRNDLKGLVGTGGLAWTAFFVLGRARDQSAASVHRMPDAVGFRSPMFEWSVQGDREIARKTWRTSTPVAWVSNPMAPTFLDSETSELEIVFLRHRKPPGTE